MKVAFVTFGCRLNRAESLDLEARYHAAGHEIIDLEGPCSCAAETPDLILVRGCSVTAKAQRDSEKAIAHLRAQFPTAEVHPLGCLPNAQPPLTTNYQLPTTVPVPMRTSRAYLKIQDGCSGKCAGSFKYFECCSGSYLFNVCLAENSKKVMKVAFKLSYKVYALSESIGF